MHVQPEDVVLVEDQNGMVNQSGSMRDDSLNSSRADLLDLDEGVEDYDAMLRMIDQRRNAGEYASVLVVDDEPINIDILQALLFAEEMLIDSALSGKEALNLVRSRCQLVKSGQAYPYKLIIIDYSMPVMSGI